MTTHFGYAAVVLALLVAGTSSAGAQYYREYDAQIPLTQAQRTIIYRTIIPQSRGRQPIVRERVVTDGAIDGYAYGDRYAWGYQRRYVVELDAYGANAFVVGRRVPASTRLALAPLPPALVRQVPTVRPYRQATWSGRVLLVDPVTGVVVADVTP